MKYWAIHSSARSFTRTAHSFVFSALLVSLARSAALIHSFARSPNHSLPSSWVFVYELNSSISLWAACLCVYVWVSACVSVRVCMRVCMHELPLHYVSIVQVGNKRLREFEKKTGYGWTDVQTDGWTN